MILDIVINVLLAALCIAQPVALLPAYFLIASFWQVPVPGIGVGSLVPFSLVVSIGFLIRFKGLYCSKAEQKYMAFLLLAWLIPSLSHRIGWGSYAPYTTDMLKSIWVFALLFVPVRHLPERRFFGFCIAAFVLAMLLIGYESVPYYIRTGASLGRNVNFICQQTEIVSNIGFRNRQVLAISQFPMGIPQSMYLSVLFAVVIAKTMLAYVQRNRKLLFCLSAAFVYGFLVFYCNQYLNTLLASVTSAVVVLGAILRKTAATPHSERARRLLAGFAILAGIALVYTFPMIIHDFGNRFEVSKYSDSRTSRFLELLSQTTSEAGIIGVGATRPAGSICYGIDGYLSGHSTLMDQVFAFGIPIGLISLFPFAYPFWVMFFNPRRSISLPLETHVVFLALFSAASFQAFFNIFGQNKNQLGFYIGITLLMLRYTSRSNLWQRSRAADSHAAKSATKQQKRKDNPL